MPLITGAAASLMALTGRFGGGIEVYLVGLVVLLLGAGRLLPRP